MKLSTILIGAFGSILLACGGESNLTEGHAQGITSTQKERADAAGTTESTTKREIESFEHPSAELQGQVNRLLGHYLTLKKNLVESSAEGASQTAGSFLASLEEFEIQDIPEDQASFYKEKRNEMEKFIRSIAENENLEAQRGSLPVITEDMYSLVKAFKANKEVVYYQYCPMAFNNNGGYWLSNSKEILNPYYGEKMLHCGRVTETIRN